MSLNVLAIGLTVLSCGALAWPWRRAAPTWSWLDRAAAVAVLPPALLTFWLLYVKVVAGAPAIDWNGARLAPTFALVKGYALYYPPNSGPILNMVYGPLTPLAFLPAVLFSSPTAAILCAAVLNDLFIVAPLLVFQLRAARGDFPSRLIALVCWLGAAVLMARLRPTYYWISMVHSDAPALALGMLACVALWGVGDDPPTPRRLAASAVLAVLSVFAKQTSAPLPIALALFVWVAHGPGAFWRYAGALALAGVGLGLAFVLLWGFEPMYFNMFAMLGSQAWLRPGIGGLLATLHELLLPARESLALLAIGATLTLVGSHPREGGFRTWVRRNPWLLPILPALFMVPTGVLGAVKLGGDQNSLHSLYYLIAAVAVLLAWNATHVPNPLLRGGARLLCYGFCAANLWLAWQHGKVDLWGPPPAPVHRNNNQEAYEFIRRHPGEAYFEWQPLASLMAEGKLYHFEYGIFDRFLAGYEPTPEHVRAHLPPRMHLLVSRHRPWILRYFPEYTEETQLDELPGWKVYTPPAG